VNRIAGLDDQQKERDGKKCKAEAHGALHHGRDKGDTR
jgi:hypothetical protein